jgi:hypothetical protein
MKTANITEMENAELLTRFRNAHTTYQACHGHFKAERNKAAADYYRAEIIRRNMTVPSEPGDFNGPGSV